MLVSRGLLSRLGLGSTCDHLAESDRQRPPSRHRELTPASSRSQARANGLQQRIVQGSLLAQDLRRPGPSRKSSLSTTRFAIAITAPVGELRKTLWVGCRGPVHGRGQLAPRRLRARPCTACPLITSTDLPPLGLSKKRARCRGCEVVPNLHHPYGSDL